MMNEPSAEEGPNTGVAVPDEVVAAAAREQVTHSERPAWIDHFVWQSLWKVVVVGLATTAIVWATRGSGWVDNSTIGRKETSTPDSSIRPRGRSRFYNWHESHGVGGHITLFFTTRSAADAMPAE